MVVFECLMSKPVLFCVPHIVKPTKKGKMAYLLLMLKFLPKWRCLSEGCLDRPVNTVSRSASNPGVKSIVRFLFTTNTVVFSISGVS